MSENLHAIRRLRYVSPVLSHRQREAMNEAMRRYEADADAPCARPLEFLLRSVARLELGRFEDASGDARRVTDAKLARVSGHLLFACGKFGEGLDVLATVPTSSARSLRARLSAKVGWTLDALEAIDEAVDAGDATTAAGKEAQLLHAANIYAEARHDAKAHALAAEAHSLGPTNADAVLLSAELAPYEKREEALASLRGAALFGEGALRAASAFRRLGSDADAVQCLERAFEGGPPKDEGAASEGRALLALMAFEAGDDALAHRLARAAGDFEGRGRVAEYVLGALALCSGDLTSAERILLRAAKGGDDPLLLSWLAELYLQQGRYDDARATLHRARLENSRGFGGPLALQRLVLACRTVERGQRLGAHRFREVDALLRHYAGAAAAAEVMKHGDAAAVATLAEEALLSMGRRRSVAPPELGLTGSRGQLRRAIERIRVLGDEALEEFDRDAAKYGWKGALCSAHRGELLLWLGRYEEATTCLRSSIDEDARTRWPYIGLSAIALMRGEGEEALRLNAEGIAAMDGTIGGSVYLHRGEALRLVGRFDESRAELVRALQLHPNRISAALNLALVAEELGEATLAEAMWRRIHHQAPGLMGDAARHLSADAAPADLAAEALRMFGANRSSTCLSYVARTKRGARRRFVRSARRDAQDAHTVSRSELGRLRASLGLREGASPPTASLAEATAPALLEHFVEHGYCALRGAFSPEAAAEWTRRAASRVRSFPDLYVKGYGAESPPLWAFREDDADTWSWERIELLASGRLPFAEFSPPLWSALRGLLGPAIATEMWSDYFVMNLRENHGAVGAPGDARGWHVDDPGPAMSLEALRNGLVLVMLFSDCDEGEGGTLLLEGSDSVVARHLRENPGADLSDIAVTERLARGSSTFHQVSGKAGDVYLCSSLLLHTSAPNPSGKIRWMANPMIHLRTPPNLESEAPTPFERSLLRALGPRA